jgi:hypothetical protein
MRPLALVLALALASCSLSFSPSPSPSPSIRDGAVDAPPQLPPSASSITTVITVEDAQMVVLSETTDPTWGVGLAWTLDDEPGYLVHLLALRNVDVRALPIDVRERAARQWQLVGPRGACSARLGTPVLVRRVDGDVAQDVAADDVPLADHDTDAARSWSAGLEVLAAPIVPIEGSCDDARFATTSTLAHVYVETAIDDALDREARAAFVDLTAFRAMQVDYEDYAREVGMTGEVRLWAPGDDYDPMTVRRLHAEGANDLVLVQAGEELCWGFQGTLFALFERTPDGLVLVDSGTTDGAPEMVVDAADGVRRYVAFERWRALTDRDEDGWPRWHDMRSPWFGCAC